MNHDDEVWRDFERSDSAGFIGPIRAPGPMVDFTFPEDLAFSLEQGAFVTSLVSHLVQDLTYELSHKWARHMIDILVAGEWQVPDDVEPAATPGPRNAPSSSE